MPQELKSNANRDHPPRALVFKTCGCVELFKLSPICRAPVWRLTPTCDWSLRSKMSSGLSVNVRVGCYWEMPLTEQHFLSTNREWVECGYDVIRQVSEVS